jgi:hypothetical protein
MNPATLIGSAYLMNNKSKTTANVSCVLALVVHFLHLYFLRFRPAHFSRPRRLPATAKGHLNLAKTFRKVTKKDKTVQFGTVWYRLANRNSLLIQDLRFSRPQIKGSFGSALPGRALGLMNRPFIGMAKTTQPVRHRGFREMDGVRNCPPERNWSQIC